MTHSDKFNTGKYALVSKEILDSIASSEAELNRANAAKARAEAAETEVRTENAKRRRYGVYVSIVCTGAYAAMLSAMAYYYIKQGRSCIAPPNSSAE